MPQLPCAKALYNYDGKEPGDLKFSKGDVIILRRQVDENWYHGEMGGVHGFFPTNFVQVVKPLPQPPPQCKALYDFELKDKEADKDCLPFSKVSGAPPAATPSTWRGGKKQEEEKERRPKYTPASSHFLRLCSKREGPARPRTLCAPLSQTS